MDSAVAPAQEADRVGSDVRAVASEARAAPGAQADSAVPGIPAARAEAEVRRAEAARGADTDFTQPTPMSVAPHMKTNTPRHKTAALFEKRHF